MTEAALHAWLCWGLIGAALLVFFLLQWIDAPYGRHERKGWGPTMPTRWMWVVMESPACVGFAILFFLGRHRFELVPLILLGLWQLHYFHRTFIYPMRIRSTGKRTPVLVALMGATFQSLNTYVNARFISELGEYAVSWLYDPRFIVGVLLFFVGRHINMQSDAILIALRKDNDDYQIPRRGFYHWVSCPNYMGEIMEWTAWALMTWSLSGAAFAAWTVANLVPRAVAHHRWYQEKFPDYPKDRHAVIPFLV
jgi:3-oxo-5-alpha-steroid 4-dehydrogenase 1